MRKVVLVLLCAALALAGCAAGATAPMPRLTIAAGEPGGVYHALGQALAAEAGRRWSIRSEVVPSSESVENLRLVAEGKADIGFATIDVCTLALQGDFPFRAGLPLAALAGIYEDYLQIVVRAESPIKTAKDLAGKRVSTGPAGSGTELVAWRIFDTVGINFTMVDALALSTAEAAQRLRLGGIDAFFALGGLPTPAIAELATQVPIRVLSLPGEVSALRQRTVGTYLLRSIPVGVYGLQGDVVTVGIPNALVVRADMPPDTAFRLTELVFAAKPQLVTANREALRLDPHSAIVTYSLPLHPGAVRYYRTVKTMIS
jgi:TRAP transporter TAXI family solute receptor